MAGYIYEIQQSLNILAYGSYPPAGHPVQDAQKAANDWAGTTGLETLQALNHKNGTTNLDFNQVCNQLASITGPTLEAQEALSRLAGGGG